MLELYGTEMNILNKVSIKNIEENFGKQIAKNVEIARNGNITIKNGGGGIYGKLIIWKNNLKEHKFQIIH